MEYQSREFSVLAYANGFTDWHYRHRGALFEVILPGFFNGAKDMARTGDTLTITADDGVMKVFTRVIDGQVSIHELASLSILRQKAIAA